MRITVAIVVLVVVLALGMTATRQAGAADAGNGARLAQRWCASCHLVAPNQREPATEAPPFSDLAAHAGFDAGRLAFALLGPHPQMPDLMLSRDEAADLAAYIAVQK